MAALENEIGTPLLQRLPRGVRPTPTGLAVLDDARAALASAERVIRTGRACAEGSEGRLRLGCVETMTVPVLAPTLRTWARKYRDVDIELTEYSSADVMADAVARGDCDVAVGPESTRFVGEVVKIGTEDVVAVVPEGLDLTDRPDLSWADLLDRPVVHYHPTNGLAAWIDAEAASSEVVLTVPPALEVPAQQHNSLGRGWASHSSRVQRCRRGSTGVVKPLRPPLRRTVVAMIGSPDRRPGASRPLHRPRSPRHAEHADYDA